MIIYKKYSRQELDLQYNNRVHVPDFENYLRRWEKLSNDTAKTHNVIKDISYGSTGRECLDIFPSAKPLSKTLVFIHGGYWQRFDKSLFHFIAGAFSVYGNTTVLINYPLAPDVTMDQIVKSCSDAIKWISKNVESYNGNPDQLYIAGHSAGGHLAAMLMTIEEKQKYTAGIQGVCSISGLFNLRPIQLSNINDALQMDTEVAIRNSPVFKEPVAPCPLLVAVGGAETNEFLDQSNELYNKWKNKTASTELITLPGLNHFSVLDSFCDANSLLHQSMCRMMKI
jgi:arylformamidase